MELGITSKPLPDAVAAYGWIPFAAIIAITLLLSALYMNYFWNHHEKHRFASVIATVGLSVALLTSFLLPVDAFLVSFMKNSNGTFKEWATNYTRETVENSVSYTYYGLYTIILLFAFFLLPLAYFTYEENDDDNTCGQSLCAGMKYTVVFILFAAALLVIGVFIPYKTLPPQNGTDWEFLIREITSNKGEDALSFVLNILTVIGMLILIVYTGVGLSSFPIGMIRGTQSLEQEQAAISDNHSDTQSRISALRRKEQLTSRERNTLAELEEEEHLISRQEYHIHEAKQNILNKLWPVLQILNVVFGVIGVIFGFLLWLSLLLSNIDKAMHSLGYKMGYVLKERTLPNPLDYVMVDAQKVFPLDYILFFGIVLFLVLCTISGIRYLGLWCFCVKLYKIRPHRTQPQGLIMLCLALMYTVLAFNILIYILLPQYTTFGSQSYEYKNPEGKIEVKACSIDAPLGDCMMTRASSFLLQFMFKAWIFGAAYYWLSWAFLAASILGFFVAIIRKKQSYIDGLVDRDDFEESDDEHMITP